LKPRCVHYSARWEPVNAKGSSRLGEDDSVGDREREEPSTPIREALAVTDQRKTEETAGGGNELEDDAESDIGADIRCDGRPGQGGKPESEGATATKDEETDAEFSSTMDGRDGRHAVRSVEGQGRSMCVEGPQQGTDGDCRMTPIRGEYEEDDDDESWHGARKDGGETATCGKANMPKPGRSRKENRKASSEKKGSEIGMTDSDGT
jgi:hypothetical protein